MMYDWWCRCCWNDDRYFITSPTIEGHWNIDHHIPWDPWRRMDDDNEIVVVVVVDVDDVVCVGVPHDRLPFQGWSIITFHDYYADDDALDYSYETTTTMISVDDDGERRDFRVVPDTYRDDDDDNDDGWRTDDG